MTAINPEFIYPDATPLHPMLRGRSFSRGMKLFAYATLAGITCTSVPGIESMGLDDEQRMEIIEPETMSDTIMSSATGDLAKIVLGGAGAYYVYQNYLKDFELPNYHAGDQEEESLSVNVLNTAVYSNDIYIPLTVVSKVSVEAHENEAGLLDFLPFIDGGPAWGQQKVDLTAIGDVDIAIDGKIDIERVLDSNGAPTNTIDVRISSFRTWRPRVAAETILFNPDGDEMSGLIGKASTRDRATQIALVALQTLIAHEGCRAAGAEIVKSEFVIPFIENLLIKDRNVNSMINYNKAAGDIVRITMLAPPEDNETATIEEYTQYYSSDAAYDPDNPDYLKRPQLGVNETLALLEKLSEEVDSFTVVDGAGNRLTIDDLKERQNTCEQGVIDPVVRITVLPNGDIELGNREDKLDDLVEIQN